MRFFYPAQPSRIWPDAPILDRLIGDPNWDAEIKFNGWRTLIFKENNRILIYNRQGGIIKIDHSIFQNCFKSIPNNTIFDGELVHFRTGELKNIIVLWDCTFFKGNDLRNLPLNQRRSFLDKFSIQPEGTNFPQSNSAQIFRTRQYSGNYRNLYNKIVKRNNPLEEGLILKNINSQYKYSYKRKIDTVYWLKIKKKGNHTKI